MDIAGVLLWQCQCQILYDDNDAAAVGFMINVCNTELVVAATILTYTSVRLTAF